MAKQRRTSLKFVPITDILKKFDSDKEEIFTLFLKKTFKDILEKSPVYTGRTKNNWSMSEFSSSEIRPRPTKPENVQTEEFEIRRTDEQLQRVKNATTAYIFNNLPHVPRTKSIRLAFWQALSKAKIEERVVEVAKELKLT